MKIHSILYLLLILLLMACTQKARDKTVNTGNIPISSLVWEKKTGSITAATPVDSAILYFTRLGELYKNRDSITRWANFHYTTYNYIYDTFHNASLADRFLDTIIVNGDLLKDSTGEKLLMKSYFYKAYDMGDRGEYPQSIPLLEKFLLLGLKYAGESKSLLASAYSRLGNAYIMQGDNIRGVLFLIRSSWMFKTFNNEFGKEGVRSQCINIANVYNQMGKYTTAIKYIDTGLSVIQTKDTFRTAYLMAVKAESYIGLGLYDTAFKTAKEGLKILESLQDLNWEKIADLQSVMANSISKKNQKAAIRYYKESLYTHNKAFSNVRRREIGKKLNSLGDCYQQLSKPDSAVYYYHRSLYTVCDIDTSDIFSLPRKKELYAENTIMEALDAKAAWMTNYYTGKDKLKYWSCAVDGYDLAFEVERKLLLNFSYDESKIRMLKDSRQRSEKAITVCFKLYQETKDNQWIEKAFRFAERNKAFIVLESIRRNLAASQVFRQDTLFQKVQQLQTAYAYAEKSVIEARNNNDTSQLKQLEENKIETDGQLQIAQTSLYQNNSSYREWMEQEDSVSIEMSKKLLPDDQAALVEYFVGDSTSYAIIITANGSDRMVAISNNSITSIDSFQFFFSNKNKILNDPTGYQRTANIAYINWLKPCIEKFTGNKLLIIPDDRLALLPFDALITDITAGNNLQTWSYLIKKYQVNIGFSVSTLLKQKSIKQSSAGGVAFAPGFMNKERNLTALPFTAEEIDNIKNADADAGLYKERDATLTRFRNLAPGLALIHIASHANSDSINGMAAIEFADSALLLNELYAMRLNADLVILSACETGIGKIEKGEGAMSLARGFYYAGAKSIITSLWSINDQATAILFKDFYQHINSQNFSHALHQSKMDYLSAELTNDKYSPYYWAGFICIGSTDTGNTKQSNKWIWPAGIALAFLILLVFWKKPNKKGPAVMPGPGKLV